MTRALAATLFAALVLIPAAGTHGIKEGGTFRVGAGPIPSIDPAVGAPYVITRPTCAALMTFPAKPLPEGFRLVPEIAADYPKVTNGGRTYTFTIQKGVRFSTGSRVTARSFVHTINRLLHPQLESFVATKLTDIVGAQKVIDGKTETASGVFSRGDSLVIRLKKPVGDFAMRLASVCVVPEATPIDPEGVKAPAPAPARTTSPSSFSGSGSDSSGTASTAAPDQVTSTASSSTSDSTRRRSSIGSTGASSTGVT